MIARTGAAAGLLLFSLLPLLAACSGSEGRAARYLERGQQYFAEKNYDKARIEISNALQIDQKNAPARVVAARIAEKQANLRDAVANYLAAIEADPDNIDARAGLGRLYVLGGLPDKASEIIAPALEKAPGDARLLTVRGGLRAVTGDTAGALADAEAAVKAAPDDEIALALLAAQYRRAGRDDEAIATLHQGIERHPDSVDLRIIMSDVQLDVGHPELAEEQLKTVADRNRTTLGNWQNLARFYLVQKNPAGAEQAMRDAVQYNPESVEAKYSLVGLLANQKDSAAAQQQMLEFVKAEPKRTELKIALGQFYEANRKPTEAEAVYREVIAAEGVKTQGLVARDRLAAILVQRPDVAGAEQLIAQVLAENPRDNDALVLRAGIALSRNETAAAITDLRAVLRDQPNSQPLMRVLARAHMQDRDTALAEEVLRSAVQVNPADLPSRFDLAMLLAQTGRANLAQPILEQLGKDAPDDIAVREALFRAQGTQQDWKGAEATAEEIKRLRPDLPTGYLLAGALREREKKYGAAIAEYERALRHASNPLQVLPVLVAAQLRANQAQAAAARLTAFLQETPDSAVVHQLLGEVRLTQRDFAGAIAGFEQAVALDPKLWVAYRGKAIAHDSAGKPELAVAAVQAGYAASGALDLGVDLATRQDRLGRHDEAIRVYEDLHRRAPDSLPVANNLAMLLVNRRGDAASLAQAEKLGELLAASTEPAFLDTRGWIKFRRGQIPEALPLLKQASEKSPQSREILYHLGMAQYRSGDRGAARQNLEAALAASASFAGVEEARTTLAVLRGAG
jgi:tetratricopeptide (TPR) repeat protein